MKREYPDAPVVAVGVIIRRDDRILLIRRAKEPAKGLWTFPGGAVELGESLREAARREALEETGLHVTVGEIATVFEKVRRDEKGRVLYHYVIIDYFAEPLGGKLRPGDDVDDARWFRLAELDAVKITPLAEKIARNLLSPPVQQSIYLGPTGQPPSSTQHTAVEGSNGVGKEGDPA